MPTVNFWKWGEGSEEQQKYFASHVPEWQFVLEDCPGDLSINQAKRIIEIMIQEKDFEEGYWAYSFARKNGMKKGDFIEVGHVDTGTFI